MISGAPSSISLASLLLRLIILLYKSLRSEVANLPPSSCTIGRRSGGITGTTSIIIHEGLLPDSRNASTTSSLLTILALFCPAASTSSAFSSSESFSRSIASSSSLTASAPIPTRKESLPNCSHASLYSFSERTCLYDKVVVPGSSTI